MKEPNYEAAHKAFQECTAYWPPEWQQDADMFAKMLDEVIGAALPELFEDDDDDVD